jgi:hypothetical protein
VLAHRSLTLTIGLIMGVGCSYTVTGPPPNAPAGQAIQCDEEASARRGADRVGGFVAGSAGAAVLVGIALCEPGALFPSCIDGSTRFKASIGLAGVVVAAVYYHALYVSGKRLRACREAKARAGNAATERSDISSVEPAGLE